MLVNRRFAIIIVFFVTLFSLFWGSVLPIENNLYEYFNIDEDATTRISLVIDVGIGILFGWAIFNKGESDKHKRLKLESAEIARDISPVILALKNYDENVKYNKTMDNSQSDAEFKRLKDFLENAYCTITKKIDYSRDVFTPEHIQQLENIGDCTILMKRNLLEYSELDSTSDISKKWEKFDKIFDKQSETLIDQINELTAELHNKYKYDKLEKIL